MFVSINWYSVDHDLSFSEEGGSALSMVKINFAASVHLTSSKTCGNAKKLSHYISILILVSRYGLLVLYRITIATYKQCFIDFTYIEARCFYGPKHIF